MGDLLKLAPTQFNMKQIDPPNKDMNFTHTQYGFIAEDVAAVDHNLSIFEQDGVTPKSWRQDSVIALLVKGIQFQQAEIEQLSQGGPVVPVRHRNWFGGVMDYLEGL